MIRIGIGGWTYEPLRGTFFPAKLPKTKELSYASRRVSSIEVNCTFYGTFNPKTFHKWSDEAPDDFVFSLKGPRPSPLHQPPKRAIMKPRLCKLLDRSWSLGQALCARRLQKGTAFA